MIVPTLTDGVIPAIDPTPRAPRTPRMIPIIPPSNVMIPASARNCSNTEPVRAPSAFLIPISLVLSVTDTSMIFITPIPPTSREIAATKEIKMVMKPSMVSNCEEKSVKLSIIIWFSPRTLCLLSSRERILPATSVQYSADSAIT